MRSKGLRFDEALSREFLTGPSLARTAAVTCSSTFAPMIPVRSCCGSSARDGVRSGRSAPSRS